MNNVTIYHNPECGTSRNTLGLIRNAGIEPRTVKYLSDPPSREQLATMISNAGLNVREALREKGTPFASLGLANPALTDDQLLDAMVSHPILINRPFVVTALGTRLCRPSERVLDILPLPQKGAYRKEDGELVINAVPAEVADLPAIRDLLLSANLPATDLTDDTAVRFWLARECGLIVGTVALEYVGSVAILRSLAVRTDQRGTGLGRALLQHAELRARSAKLQALWLLTTTAAELFLRNGYETRPRSESPEAVRQSAEFASICPASAVCMVKVLAEP